MNRRDFLRPRLLARLAEYITPVVESDPSRSAVEPETAVLCYARRAMATTFEIVLPLNTSRAQQAAQDAFDEIDRLEAQLSVYREESEITRINCLASRGAVQVEQRLFRLLEMAARLTQETDGAFDISVGALIKAWGFYRRQGRVPPEEERDEVMKRVGMKHISLDPAGGTISFRYSGLEINLGSIGKGYALDRAGEDLRRKWGVQNVLLHGGQSSVLAFGNQPGRRRGWIVGIRHPDRRGRLGELELRNRALGTSAATFQHLEYNGKKLGHILDPRTGWPAESIASASVTAPEAAEADALATAFFVLGIEKARVYCHRHPAIGAVLLPAGQNRPVVLGYARQESVG